MNETEAHVDLGLQSARTFFLHFLMRVIVHRRIVCLAASITRLYS